MKAQKCLIQQKVFIAGRTSFSGTLEMHFDEADSVQTQLVAGSSITFKLLPEGGSSGDRKFDCKCYVQECQYHNL